MTEISTSNYRDKLFLSLADASREKRIYKYASGKMLIIIHQNFAFLRVSIQLISRDHTETNPFRSIHRENII